MRPFGKENYVGILGLVLLAAGSYLGLVVAPQEKFMGDVGRILYLHVPTAWGAMVVSTSAFIMAVGSLITRGPRWDAGVEGAVTTTAIYTAMLLIQGSIWARPTWGVYWTWDPRLTTSAIMMVAFVGVLALRSFVDDPGRRATWSAVTTIIAFVDVPIVYFSIKWWRTLHQDFSSPDTVNDTMVLPLRLNAFAMLFIAGWLTTRVARLSLARRERGATPPEPVDPGMVAGGAS